jgi:5-methylcytosine-specific restriction endonuclease McrA
MKLSEVYKKDKGICHLCGKIVKRSDATRDHIYPKAWGGTAGHKSRYLRLAHRHCNELRGEMSLEEAREFFAQPQTNR